VDEGAERLDRKIARRAAFATRAHRQDTCRRGRPTRGSCAAAIVERQHWLKPSPVIDGGPGRVYPVRAAARR
jgi:hypothetical protein